MRIGEIKGVGEKTEALFGKLHITTTKELIQFFPRAYDHFEKEITLGEAVSGQLCSIQAVIMSHSFTNKRMKNISVQSFVAVDARGDKFRVTFFNMPYLKNTLKFGVKYVFRGSLQVKGQAYVMDHPKMYSPEEYDTLRDTLQPIYPLTKGLTNTTMRKSVKKALEAEKRFLSEDMLHFCFPAERYQDSYEFAVTQMHFPDTYELLAQARDRLVYQEFFLFLLKMRLLKDTSKQVDNAFPMVETAQVKRLMEQLPYRLTKDQMQVYSEIIEDMTGPYAMSRLVQGDVGSGKTILAFLAMLLATTNGYQSAIMAPTEVLATQHFENFCQMNETYQLGLNIRLLTGSVTAKNKKEIYRQIEEGTCQMVVGTHALIQEPVAFQKLALVVTDEQHRFGVKQRMHFSDKGLTPHILVMSATPIPRTLAMILYGDMNLSVIHQMPVGRKPIKNCVVDESFRQNAYQFMKKQIAQGHQVYVICPMVEEGELEGLENVNDYAKKLRGEFPESVRIASLHGKMKPADKNRMMQEFGAGNIDILVSTTVVEVGVNVPNATVMMVENAERFGLAQLHQLRGRVGRGDAQSYCIFMSDAKKKEITDRLKVLEKSNDGFEIAGQDMKRRGPGDLFGFRQSGALYFQLGDIYNDSELLKQAEEDVTKLLSDDPELMRPEHVLLKSYLEQDDQISVDFRSI